MSAFTYSPDNPEYKTPFGALREGQSARIRVRVARSGAAFSVYLALEADGREAGLLPMKWLGQDGADDVYECELAGLAPGLYWYWFVQDIFGDRTAYGAECPWQLTVFRADYITPGWFDAGVTYHVFVDRFFRLGPPPAPKAGRNFKLHGDWHEPPDLYPKEQLEQNWDFFGGNLAGVTEKLGYLESLGVTTIYLSPIFESASNHRYDTGDYRQVDPVAGTEADLQSLCVMAGRHGMRVILDGVFNHTGSDSRYFNEKGLYGSVGAAQSQESPYYGWYRFRRWPDDYECWWGVKTLPQTDKSNEAYISFTLESEDSVVKHWLAAGASGYRLDVADELPREYLERLRRAVKGSKPDAVIVGEVWEDPSNKTSYGVRRRYFQGLELDGVTNYPARDAVLAFAGSNMDAGGLCAALNTLHEHIPAPSRRCSLNVLGTHDTPRSLTVLGAGPEALGMPREQKALYAMSPDEYTLGKRRLMLASALQYMLPGSPCLYYGDEAGLTGFEDPLNRRTYPWGREDNELLAWYQTLGLMRRNYAQVFQQGSFSARAFSQDAVELRREFGGKAVVAVVNRGQEPVVTAFPPDSEVLAGEMENSPEGWKIKGFSVVVLALCC